MKRLSAIFLIILALFLGLPRQACACNEDKPQSADQEHVCCKSKEASCHASNKAAIKCGSCCDAASSHPVALTSSIIPQFEGQPPVLQLLFFVSTQPYISRDDDSPANSNRAPPRLTGMGTNKTYLYKRTFLI
jgi:hypothetical protein